MPTELDTLATEASAASPAAAADPSEESDDDDFLSPSLAPHFASCATANCPNVVRRGVGKCSACQGRRVGAKPAKYGPYPKKNCKVEGCVNKVVTQGELLDSVACVCCRHGAKRGNKPCSVEGCDKISVRKGVCHNHGGRKICIHPGCESNAKNNGVCRRHGATVRMCAHPGCPNQAASKGPNYALCIRHQKHAAGEAVRHPKPNARSSVICTLQKSTRQATRVSGSSARPVCAIEGCTTFARPKGDMCGWHIRVAKAQESGATAATTATDGAAPPVQVCRPVGSAAATSDAPAPPACPVVIRHHKQAEGLASSVSCNLQRSTQQSTRVSGGSARPVCTIEGCTTIARPHSEMCAWHIRVAKGQEARAQESAAAAAAGGGGKVAKLNNPRALVCGHEGCFNNRVNNGVCYRHGAVRKRCSVEGCSTPAARKGLCGKHGGRRICSFEGCTKQVKNSGVCLEHGATVKRCTHEGCPNQLVAQGYCVRHLKARGISGRWERRK